ncbi:MAG: copper amine oxidase N-terminal domain-containing protein [Bacilli bacterium]|nr:copper amine oxidase N-terminal domain-containing protein [Bacilli bacterium]
MMKKIIVGLTLLLIAALITSPVLAERNTTKPVEETPKVYFVDHIYYNGTAMIPIRTIFEDFGLNIAWNDSDKTMYIMDDSTYRMELSIGDKTAISYDVPLIDSSFNLSDKYLSKTNIRNTSMDVVPMIIDGKTMVPLKFVSDTLDIDIALNDNQTISVSKVENPSNLKNYLTRVVNHSRESPIFNEISYCVRDINQSCIVIRERWSNTKYLETVCLKYSDEYLAGYSYKALSTIGNKPKDR